MNIKNYMKHFNEVWNHIELQELWEKTDAMSSSFNEMYIGNILAALYCVNKKNEYFLTIKVTLLIPLDCFQIENPDIYKLSKQKFNFQFKIGDRKLFLENFEKDVADVINNKMLIILIESNKKIEEIDDNSRRSRVSNVKVKFEFKKIEEIEKKMKNEPAFKVGEEVYYIDLDNDKIVLSCCEIGNINKQNGIITYDLRANICGVRADVPNVPEKNVFKTDVKSFFEKLTIAYSFWRKS